MVTVQAAVAILLLATGTDAPVAEAPTVRLAVWAVEAVKAAPEAPKTFTGLPSEVRDAVQDLDYTEFRLLGQQRELTRLDEAATIALPGPYTLQLRPEDVDENGRVRLHARVVLRTRLPDGTERKRTALDTRSQVQPGTHLSLAGLRLPAADGRERHLVVIIAAEPAEPRG
jgi:uncharacterized lipoprotein YbaY